MGDYQDFDTSDLGLAFEKAVSRHPTLQVDVAHYQDLLDDPELTPEQQHQVLEALWTIITAFVELGFNVHPVNQACGQLPEDFAQSAQDPPDSVK